MKIKILSLLVVFSVSTAQAGKIECKGSTISEDGSRPANIILTYESFPTKIRKLTVITDKSRSWKINTCHLVPESECHESDSFDPNAPDYAVVAINRSGAALTEELGLFIGKEKGAWIGYFWDGSIMNPEVEITSCRVRSH